MGDLRGDSKFSRPLLVSERGQAVGIIGGEETLTEAVTLTWDLVTHKDAGTALEARAAPFGFRVWLREPHYAVVWTEDAEGKILRLWDRDSSETVEAGQAWCLEVWTREQRR